MKTDTLNNILILGILIGLLHLFLLPVAGIAQISQGGKPLSFKKDINLSSLSS